MYRTSNAVYQPFILTFLLTPTVQGLMFAKDFKRHCEAADAIREALGELYDEVRHVACRSQALPRGSRMWQLLPALC